MSLSEHTPRRDHFFEYNHGRTAYRLGMMINADGPHLAGKRDSRVVALEEVTGQDGLKGVKVTFERPEHPTITCPDCGGSGDHCRHKECSFACATCKGDGFIPEKDSHGN